MKLDKEEQEILQAYESDKLTPRKPTKRELKTVKETARNTFRKDQRITIRLYDHDLKGIQKKAMESGVPYQTLISGMIHRYVEGELIEKVG
jgi:predicted DNA binding CopG/RHH family protein